MSLSERSRAVLYRRLSTVIEDEEAVGEMLTQLTAVEAEQVATKDFVRAEVAVAKDELRIEIAELRTEMRTGFTEVHARLAEQRTELHSELRKQTVWLATVVLSTMTLLSGINAWVVMMFTR